MDTIPTHMYAVRGLLTWSDEGTKRQDFTVFALHRPVFAVVPEGVFIRVYSIPA